MDYKENKSPDKYIKDQLLDYANELESEIEDDMEENDVDNMEEDEDIIKIFNQNRSKMESKWSDIYDDMEDDWEMYILDQWNSDTKRGNRPKLTMDISRKFVKAIVAETYRNPPGIKLNARDDKATPKAKALAEAIRYFEDYTGAIQAYSWAKECAAVAGLGWIKVTFRIDEQQNLPSVIDIDRVEDPLSIMLDPDSKELDGSDALFAMESFGKSNGKECFTYWWKDEDGIVKWALIEGNEVKDKAIWPSTEIPLVPVYGETFHIRDNVKLFGIIRQLSGTQKTYNYCISEGIERLALTPKSPIIAEVGAIPDAYMKDWQRSMLEPVPILLYNSNHPQTNQPIARPERGNSTPDVNWLPSMLQSLENIAKETTGIYDTSLGNQGFNQTESGVAIKAKQSQGDRGQLIYDTHLKISIKQVGNIMLDLLEPIISPTGILPIMSEDGTKSIVKVGELDMFGMPVQGSITDLTSSDLDISVSTQPAYATRKEEGINKMIELMTSIDPSQASAMVPQLMRDMDFPGSSAYANILDPQPTEGQTPEMLMQQMNQMQQQLQTITDQANQLAQANQQLEFQLQNNTNAILTKAQMDNDTKIIIERMKQEGNMVENQVKIATDDETANQNLLELQFKENQTNVRKFAELDAKATADNKKLAMEAKKMQQDMINKIEVQPVAVIDNTY